MTLGTLEKTMKKKTIILKFRPRRIKTMKEKTTTLGALEKSRKKKIMALKVQP
jgi:hypothetical protein